MPDSRPAFDLVLSSGFLAFARHIGVARALRTHGVTVDAIVGTSSGAVVGAMLAMGMPLERIQKELSSRHPLSILRPTAMPWRGALSIRGFLALLREFLPARFSDLERPLGIGVMTRDKTHTLITEGSLPEAVAASCALPYVFGPVNVDGRAYRDGGAVDRVGLAAAQAWRGDRPRIIHEVARSHGRDVAYSDADALVIKTPRSGASFLSLGDFPGQVREAEAIAERALGER